MRGSRTPMLAMVCVLVLFGCDDDDERPDGGAPDAGAADAGAGDAGAPDAGTEDAATDDAGTDAGDSVDGGTAAARESASVFFVGHSLINFDMPAMLEDIARSAGVTHSYDAQVGNGAPLWWQWEHYDTADGADAVIEVPSGRYDVLVMTELIPIAHHVEYSDTIEYAGRFYDLAVDANPSTQVYLYETWYDVEDPAWRENIVRDRAIWAGVVDEVNAAHEGPDMLLVPGGAALGRLVDHIEAGEVPGIESRRDLFIDEIHLNDLGNYFIALVQFATIYRQSPVGVTFETTSRFDEPFMAPEPEAARIMQEIAWEVVSHDPRAGVCAAEECALHGMGS